MERFAPRDNGILNAMLIDLWSSEAPDFKKSKPGKLFTEGPAACARSNSLLLLVPKYLTLRFSQLNEGR